MFVEFALGKVHLLDVLFFENQSTEKCEKEYRCLDYPASLQTNGQAHPRILPHHNRWWPGMGGKKDPKVLQNDALRVCAGIPDTRDAHLGPALGLQTGETENKTK